MYFAVLCVVSPCVEGRKQKFSFKITIIRAEKRKMNFTHDQSTVQSKSSCMNCDGSLMSVQYSPACFTVVSSLGPPDGRDTLQSLDRGSRLARNGIRLEKWVLYSGCTVTIVGVCIWRTWRFHICCVNSHALCQCTRPSVLCVQAAMRRVHVKRRPTVVAGPGYVYRREKTEA
jgi:hypothetical protein